MSRKERKRLERATKRGVAAAVAPPPVSQKVSLKEVKPITINQSKVCKAWASGEHLVIHGYAGTGKSFLALWLALNEVENLGTYRHVILIRSAVPSRSQGFLPGTQEEKDGAFELPYRDIVDDLYGRGGTYNRLKETKVIDFMSTGYLRGRTFDNAVIIVDEVQNMTDQEINTVMTRVGENSRVIICGDFRQNDLENKRHEQSCIGTLMETLGRMPSFTSIEMGLDDIVRSGLVKEWIIAREIIH